MKNKETHLKREKKGAHTEFERQDKAEFLGP